MSGVADRHEFDRQGLAFDAAGCICGWNAKATGGAAQRLAWRKHYAAEVLDPVMEVMRRVVMDWDEKCCGKEDCSCSMAQARHIVATQGDPR